MNDNSVKKPIQTQRKSKKRRVGIFLGFCIGALGAAATTTLLAQISKSKGDQPSQTYTLNFGLDEKDIEEGAKITGKTSFKFKNEVTLDSIETPIPVKTIKDGSATKDFPFVDWIDSTGSTVKYNQIIKSSTKLTATFSDYWQKRGETLFNIYFETLDSQDHLTGLTKIAVPEGRTFASINKPKVSSDNPARTKFKGWALKDSPNFTVNQDLIITQNLTFVPVFGSAITVNYNVRSDETLASGSPVSVTEAGQSFANVNQPTLTKSGYVFAGWAKTKDGTPVWSPEEVITDVIPEGGYQAWALWKLIDDPEVSILHFIKNTTTGQPASLVFSGSETVAIPNGSTWSSINRPTPVAAGWKIKSWQYVISDTEPGSGAEWKDLEPSTQFPEEQLKIYIRPVMQPNADAVKVLGKDTVVTGSTTQYSAYVAPSEAKQDVEWKLCADETGTQLQPGVATITTDGKLTVHSTNNNQPIYVKAISTVDADGKIFDIKKVTIQPPYVGSYDYYTFVENVSDPSQSRWYRLTGLAGDNEICLWNDESNEPVQTIERKLFNLPVYVGTAIKSLPPMFLVNCDIFNKPVTWTSNLESIASHFMVGCPKFNQKLDLSNIQTIDKMFMARCFAFNNGSTTATENPIALQSAYSIGDGFMDQCTTLDSRIDFGTGNKVKIIGSDFLNGCVKYNKTLKFPSSLEHVGDKCMYNCDRFQAFLYCNANPSVFGNSDLNFSSNNKNSYIAKSDYGFKVGGDNASLFLEKFGSIAHPSTTETGSAYRTSKLSGVININNCTWTELGTLIEQFESGAISEDDFRSNCLINGKKPESFASYVGVLRTIRWYGLDHKIRIVATCMDDQFNANNKVVNYVDDEGVTHRATFVFQFANALTWTYGSKRGWMSTKIDKYNNLDLINSGMRKAYDNMGSGEFCWIQGCAPPDWNFQNGAIDYIPKDIKKYMKKAIRYCVVSTNGVNWKERTEKQYETTFFSPTAMEWGRKDAAMAPVMTEHDNKPFSYYRQHPNAADRRTTIVDGQYVYVHFLTPYINLNDLNNKYYVSCINFSGDWTLDCPIGSGGGSCQLTPCFCF